MDARLASLRITARITSVALAGCGGIIAPSTMDNPAVEAGIIAQDGSTPKPKPRSDGAADAVPDVAAKDPKACLTDAEIASKETFTCCNDALTSVVKNGVTVPADEPCCKIILSWVNHDWNIRDEVHPKVMGDCCEGVQGSPCTAWGPPMPRPMTTRLIA